MIKDNQKLLNRLHVIIDAILIVLAFVLAYYIRFKMLVHFKPFALAENERYYSLAKYAENLYYLVPVYLLAYYGFNLYKPKRGGGHRLQMWNLFKANAFGLLVFATVLYVIKENNISRWVFATFATLNFSFGVIFRYILERILWGLRKRGFNQKHILMVGYSRTAEAYIDRIRQNPHWGYHIHGILDDNMEAGTMYKKAVVIGNCDELAQQLEKNSFDEIVVTLSINEYSKLEQLVGICEKSGVHTKFVPDYQTIIPTVPVTEDMDGLPVINIRNVPLNSVMNRMIKRTMDLVGASLALLVALIPMIIIAIIIKCTSKGPIIFSQVRVGLHNRQFKMYKFRSMEVQSEKKERKAWTTANDARVTAIGRIIRKTSLDELPQLFNILKGDMSLIGPRPERPYFVEKFKEEIPRYMIKHQVRPGLSGWAQVNGYRGDTSIRKRIEHDLYYIENWSVGLDIKICFLTIFKGFINKNAY
ncbi:MAG: undecaprenyl-phosphate glucose phosphotransferase [Lachnospiraceae bacterium]|nr:undecaprenyl-phosphate glucose phosphotransferase [Lachnospiraceae bacterium]